jgi:hypothetical protein
MGRRTKEIEAEFFGIDALDESIEFSGLLLQNQLDGTANRPAWR